MKLETERTDQRVNQKQLQKELANWKNYLKNKTLRDLYDRMKHSNKVQSVLQDITERMRKQEFLNVQMLKDNESQNQELQ